MALTATLQKRGMRLLHLQCWLWGQDVRRPEGNLLLQQGFARLPAPAGVTGCTQYSRSLPGQEQLCLWGFGFFFGRSQSTSSHEAGGCTRGLFVRRYEFLPRHVPVKQDVWEASKLARCRPSRDYGTLARAVHCIAAMEQAVHVEQGLPYRHRCMAGWKGKLPEVEGLPQRWLEFAAGLEKLTGTQAAP